MEEPWKLSLAFQTRNSNATTSTPIQNPDDTEFAVISHFDIVINEYSGLIILGTLAMSTGHCSYYELHNVHLCQCNSLSEIISSMAELPIRDFQSQFAAASSYRSTARICLLVHKGSSFNECSFAWNFQLESFQFFLANCAWVTCNCSRKELPQVVD